MSDLARFWSKRVRGLNISEHAVLFRLADYHVATSDLCFPNHYTLCEDLECSNRYLRDILQRLERWNFLTRIECSESFRQGGRQIVEHHKRAARYDGIRQTSNRYRLHLKNFFPRPERNTAKDERDYSAYFGAAQGNVAAGIVKKYFQDADLAANIRCFLQTPRTRKTAKLTASEKLWITAESESHRTHLMRLLPTFGPVIREKLENECSIELLTCFPDKTRE